MAGVLERERERGLVLAAFEARDAPRGRRRDLSTAELVLATGLPEPELLSILPALAAEYGASVAATEAGEVLWRFPGRLEPRRPRRQPVLALLAKAAAASLEVLAKVAIGSGYSLWAFFAWSFLAGRRPDSGASRGAHRLSFYSVVFSFVFGGTSDPDEARKAQAGRDFLAWAATRSGLVSATEYALYAGLSADEALERLALFAAEYSGEPEALGGGILAWRFPLAPGQRPIHAPRPWRLMKPFSDNPPVWDAVAGSIALADILLGGLVTVLASSYRALIAAGLPTVPLHEFLVRFFGLSAPETTLWALGLLPLMAGSLGLLVPGIRALRIQALRRRRSLENDRTEAGHLVLAGRGRISVPMASETANDERRAGIRVALERLAAEFGAEAEPDERSALTYRFQAIQEELAVLDEARRLLAPRVAEPGAVVYDSGEAADSSGAEGVWR